MLITQNQVFLIAFSPGFVAMPVMRPRKIFIYLFIYLIYLFNFARGTFFGH